MNKVADSKQSDMIPPPDNHHGMVYRSLLKAHPLLCRLVPAVAVLCIAAWCFVSLHAHFSSDDAEPEILNIAWQLANGKGIYGDVHSPPFSFAAYTPLYYALVAAFMQFTGLSFIPAKLLSLVAALAIGAAFMQLSLKWRGSRFNGLWGAFFLFLIPAFLFNAIRCHAQMLAVAFSIWSLVFFLKNRFGATVVISPLLAILALYTKQTQIALPLAIILFLLLRNRRWLAPYTATLILAGLIPFLWLQWITEGKFFLNTFTNHTLLYNVFQIPLILIHHAGPIFLCIGLALVLCRKRLKSREWGAMDYYLVSVFVVTIITVGRVGAHGQYVVELLVVIVLYLIYTTDFPFLKRRKLLISVQILCLFMYAPLFILVEEGSGNISSYRAAQKIYPLLKAESGSEPGPILSQQGSFALFSRGEIYIQLFHFSGLARAGLWDQRHILEPIDNRVLSWVITEFPIESGDLYADDNERFTPELVEALKRNYKRREVFVPYYLYAPKPYD